MTFYRIPRVNYNFHLVNFSRCTHALLTINKKLNISFYKLKIELAIVMSYKHSTDSLIELEFDRKNWLDVQPVFSLCLNICYIHVKVFNTKSLSEFSS